MEAESETKKPGAMAEHTLIESREQLFRGWGTSAVSRRRRAMRASDSAGTRTAFRTVQK